MAQAYVDSATPPPLFGENDAYQSVYNESTTAESKPADQQYEVTYSSPMKGPSGLPQPGSIPLPMPEHEDLHTYVQRARNISMFSIVFTLCCAGVGLGFYWSTNSSALLGYALEALVDVWSSALVLWRFWSDPEGEGKYFLITRRREARASVGIAVTFVLIGFITCWQAVVHLMERRPPSNSDVLLAISGTSVIILTWSSAMKFSLAKVLRSTSLHKDAITSAAVATMAGTMLISTTVYKSHPKIWWLDAAVALIVSVVLSVLGIKTLATNPWWTSEFWNDGEVAQEEKPAEKIMRLGRSKSRNAGTVEMYMREARVEGDAEVFPAADGRA